MKNRLKGAESVLEENELEEERDEKMRNKSEKRENSGKKIKARLAELGHAKESSTKLSISKIMKPQGGSNAN